MRDRLRRRGSGAALVASADAELLRADPVESWIDLLIVRFRPVADIQVSVRL
jgi:hypothetical protein